MEKTMPLKYHTQTDVTLRQPSEHIPDLLLVGERLHVLNPSVYDAIEQHNPERLARFAKKQVEAGVQALAVNLGPGRHMRLQIPWIIDAITAEVDVPLFLSSSVINSEQILRQYGRNITINAVTANPETLSQYMKVVKTYETGLVVLLVKPGLVPSGVNDRVHLAYEVLEAATKAGLPLNRLYLDPVMGCRPDPFALKVSRGFPDIGTIIETIALIKELNNYARTIIGLSNGSVGLAGEKRSALHCRMLPLLASGGLDAAILNCLDNNLMNVAKNIKNGLFSHPSFQHRLEIAPAA